MQAVQPGRIVADKYRVVSTIGEGGMGLVVAAEHLHMPSRVAIKVLKRSAHREALERFTREARVLAQMASEHVTRVLDVGVLDAGEPYLVMELLDGEDLARLLKRTGPLPVDLAVDYLLQACVGIAEAHLAGIIHRDIKPSNLFRARLPDGREVLKVLDFGISKANEIAKGPGTALTKSGAMMGSPRFMSPEQLKSARDVGVEADVWSLGATLYELVTGCAAFSAPSVAELVMVILSDEPASIASVAPSAAALDPIVRRCLQREPELRPRSVRELAAALAPLSPSRSGYWLQRIDALYHAKGTPLPAVAPTVSTTDVVAPAVEPTVLDPTVDGHAAPAVIAPPMPTAAPPAAGSSTGKVLAAIGAGLVMLGLAGAGAWWLYEDGSSAAEDGASKPSKGGGTSEADRLVRGIPATTAFYRDGKTLARAVRKAHGGALRVYDLILYRDRARFVVEAKDGLVRYDLDRKGLKGPDAFDLEDSTRLDAVLLDEAALPLDTPAKIARQDGVHSVSLHRDGKGFSWQVTLGSGSVERYDLSGRKR